MKRIYWKFLLLPAVFIFLAGCPGNTKTEMWQELDGSSIIRFLDDSTIYFLSEGENINTCGKYSSNNLYVSRKTFSYKIDGNILTLDTNKGYKTVYKKLPGQNINTNIIGEWTGKNDNYLFLRNGIGFYFNNETFVFEKTGRCFAYSKDKIFDMTFGECQYSIDNGLLRISADGQEKEYVKKINQKKTNTEGFWRSESDEDFYYYFSNNGFVAENYFRLGGLFPSVYYNGTIYSFYGKTSYDIKSSQLSVELKDYIGLGNKKNDVVAELKKVPNTGISGKWKNNSGLVYDEIEFFKDGIVIFKNTKDKTYSDFVYNNGSIYNTFLMKEGRILFRYSLDNDAITIKPVITSYDETTGKFTKTTDDKEYKYTKL